MSSVVMTDTLCGTERNVSAAEGALTTISSSLNASPACADAGRPSSKQASRRAQGKCMAMFGKDLPRRTGDGAEASAAATRRRCDEGQTRQQQHGLFRFRHGGDGRDGQAVEREVGGCVDAERTGIARGQRELQAADAAE